jgi:putative transposase
MFSISQLQALMKGFPRDRFDRIVQTHQADRHTKGFSCRSHLIAMVYAQVAGASSLRTLEAGFNQHGTHHYHLGTRALRRSTLADANNKRDPAVFIQLARELMAPTHRRLRRECSPLLYLLDSTSITLKGLGFDAWTAGTATQHTQGIKVHVLYDAHGQVPVRADMSAANLNDVKHGPTVPIEAAATYVFDKGYCDYNWWHQIDQQGARFVTRFKHNAALEVVHSRAIPEEDAATVLEDQSVTFRYRHPGGGRRNVYEKPLRRVVIARPDHATPLVLATNDLDSPARDIAQRYKDRWQIELFFKWIKQHLTVKRFLGRSENAVKIQILTALITYLLLAVYKQTHRLKGSLWMVLSILRVSAFQRPVSELAADQRRRRKSADLARCQADLFA